MSSLRPLRSFSNDGEEAKVDIAPLIDVVFLLLIFYVVTATFNKPTAVPINRPQSSQSSATPERPVVVTLSADKQVFIGNEPWSVSQRQVMRDTLRKQNTDRVLLQADGAVQTDTLVRVLDACKAGGAAHIDLATDRDQ